MFLAAWRGVKANCSFSETILCVSSSPENAINATHFLLESSIPKKKKGTDKHKWIAKWEKGRVRYYVCCSS